MEIGAAYMLQEISEVQGVVHELHHLKDFTRVLNESNTPFLEIVYDPNEMNASVYSRQSAERGKKASLGR